MLFRSAVVANFVLMDVLDYQGAIEEIARVLNPPVQVVLRAHDEEEARLLAEEGLELAFVGEETLARGMAALNLQKEVVGLYTADYAKQWDGLMADMNGAKTMDDFQPSGVSYNLAVRLSGKFKTAFPKMVEKLGIVYTPIEVVDFIIHSVNEVLQSEFGQTLGSKGVHILDPFTGTGAFITRLLQSQIDCFLQIPAGIRFFTQVIIANCQVKISFRKIGI